MSQIPTLRAHIWQTKYWQIYPLKWQFHRFLLWEFIFGRPGLGKSTPSLSRSQMTISQIPNLSPHIWQTRSWKIFHLPIKQWFHRFLLWKLIFGRSGLDISTPIPHSDFTDSYFDSSYLPDQVLAYLPFPHQTVISQIPTLRVHIWQARSWQIYLPPRVLILQIPTLRVHIWITTSC